MAQHGKISNQESCPSSPSTNAMQLLVMRISPPTRTASFKMSTILTKASSNTSSRNIKRHGTRHRNDHCGPIQLQNGDILYHDMKSIVHHHLYMKTGCGYDRTFPDCMMTFAFGWGKRHPARVPSETGNLTEAQLTSMQDDFEKAIADYQVSSNERIKHITNEMLMLGHCDSDSHS